MHRTGQVHFDTTADSGQEGEEIDDRWISPSPWREITDLQGTPSDVKKQDFGSLNMEDSLTDEHLAKLHDLFEYADEDGGGGLDVIEFRNVMRKIMNGVSDHDLDIMFMKVDADCDGAVDWDEYLSYMLLEFKEKVDMNKSTEHYVSLFTGNSFRDVKSNHRDCICKVTLCTPFINNFGKEGIEPRLDYEGGRYVSVDRLGILNFWTQGMERLGCCHYLENTKKIAQLWITDLVHLPNVNMVAISSTDRDLKFYDISGQGFEKTFEVLSFPHALLCMSYHFDLHTPNMSRLLIGDDQGNCYMLTFSSCIDQGLFGLSPDKKKAIRRFLFNNLRHGLCRSVKVKVFRKAHSNWVESIRYIDDLHSFLSCSQTNDNSLLMCDVEHGLSKSYFRVLKGILCFDYCTKTNVIVTGCADHMIRLWNPYVTHKPVSIVIGHVEAVTHVFVYNNKDIFISISLDRNIRIFDIQDHACLQNFQVRRFNPINTAYFHPKSENLVIASNELAIMEHREEKKRQNRIMSHDHPVLAALYNPLFNVVASACQGSVIRVWDIETGARTMQHKNAHTLNVDGYDIFLEITAMTFDPTLRRLMTAGRDGSVKIWNFNNGDCLRIVEQGRDFEITSLAFIRSRILIGGWNRHIIMYSDLKAEVELPPKLWDKNHSEDILSMCFYDPRTSLKDTCIVATSSYDGEILLWDLDSGRMIARLNAHESSTLTKMNLSF